MSSEIRRFWRRPSYWRWHWKERVGTEAKLALAVAFALALGIAGYLSARAVGASEQAATFTRRLVTVDRTVRRAGSPRVLTDVVTAYQTATGLRQTDVVTVRRNGRVVVVRQPGKTVTLRGPAQQRVVTNHDTATVARTVTAESPITVTTGGETVTATGPTTTVDNTVTEPPQTVTETTTVTTTVTLPVTVTVPATLP